MARRKSRKDSSLGDLISLPWWFSTSLAVLVFVAFRVVVPSMEMQSFVGKVLQAALPNLAWLICSVLLLAATFSAIRSRREGTFVVNKQADLAASPKIKPAQKIHNNQEASASKAAQADSKNAAHITATEKPSTWTQDLLCDLEWKRYEELCRAYFEAKGFISKLSRVGADGGVDIHLFKGGSEKPIVLVQCKAWNTYKVGVKPVRELFGVMAAEGVPQGVFMTTGEFTDEAKEFAKGKKLVLVTGSALIQSIKAMPEEVQAKLLAVATQGYYTIPTCAKCDTKMVLRTSKKAEGDGKDFWGCTNYPRCRMTLKMRAA